MLTLHVVHARLGYGIGYINFADKEGLVLYLLTRGITDENIVKALEGLVRHGAYTIQQESRPPGTEGVGEGGRRETLCIQHSKTNVARRGL